MTSFADYDYKYMTGNMTITYNLMKTTEEVKLIDDADEVDADEVDADGVVLLELVDQLALDIVWQLLRKRSLSANPSRLPRLHPDQ